MGAGTAGPIDDPKIVTNSPGDTGPGAKLAALVTLEIAGIAAFTVRFTSTVRGATAGSRGVIVIAPVYGPGDNPPGFTDTRKFIGVIPALWSMNSQLPPVNVVALTARPSVGPVLVIASVCGDG